MKVLNQSIKLLTKPDAIKDQILICEYAARTCYNSTDKQTGNFEDAVKFLKGLIDKHHESVIEHSSISFELTTNIGVSREFLRHRLCAYSERSTRYCNFTKDKYTNGVEFCLGEDYMKQLKEEYGELLTDVFNGTEQDYNLLVKTYNLKAQQARMILPLALKTVFIVTTNIREWRHIVRMRTSNAAHPEIKELVTMIYNKFCEVGLKELFEDVYNKN